MWACALHYQSYPGPPVTGSRLDIDELLLLNQSLCEFSGDDSDMPKWRPLYTSRRVTSRISYAGHSTTLADGRRSILEWKDWLAVNSVGREITEITELDGHVHMSPYSGALTYFSFKGDQIVIDYYL